MPDAEKHVIIHTIDPLPYKEQIVGFWKEYLNGTPPTRMEWLCTGNPAGKTVWILSILKSKNELTGMISLLPKEIYHNGRKYCGAIMGDLMVHRNYRVFGPTLNLMKEAVKNISTNNFDFIYTIPNSDSTKIIQRAGLKNTTDITIFIRPIIAEYFIEKFIPKNISKIVSLIIEFGLFIFAKQTYLLPKGIIVENAEIDESFDRLWEKKKNLSKFAAVSVSSSEHLKWRYLRNPLNGFKVLTYKERENLELSGYLIYSLRNNKIKIYDIFSLEEKFRIQMMKAIIKIARKEKCHAIYYARSIEINKQNPLSRYGFIATQNNMKLYWSANHGLSLAKWDFVEGDRNI